ncbi:YndM family protein [Robertmurraya massiliosenegalensis]|uniref:YndM family protein n=1 Tax=Robertmurraya TaxID=2837507 RepID=UPI0039A4BB78
MEHFKALAIKFIASLALLYIILGLYYGMTFGTVFLITLILGIISYIVGDLGILPRTGNAIATLADFGLALAVIWVMISLLTSAMNAFTMSLFSAIAVTIFEFFFHSYMSNMRRNPEEREDTTRRKNLQYQTEASEEFTPEANKDYENRR